MQTRMHKRRLFKNRMSERKYFLKLKKADSIKVINVEKLKG